MRSISNDLLRRVHFATLAGVSMTTMARTHKVNSAELRKKLCNWRSLRDVSCGISNAEMRRKAGEKAPAVDSEFNRKNMRRNK